MSRRKVAVAGVVNLGHGPGQVCPFVWAWFGGTRDPDIAQHLHEPAVLTEWYARVLALLPAGAALPTPRGVEAHPELAAMHAAEAERRE